MSGRDSRIAGREWYRSGAGLLVPVSGAPADLPAGSQQNGNALLDAADRESQGGTVADNAHALGMDQGVASTDSPSWSNQLEETDRYAQSGTMVDTISIADIADDSVGTFGNPSSYLVILARFRHYDSLNGTGPFNHLFWGSKVSDNWLVPIDQGYWSVDTTTGSLSGTTGTDGRITVSEEFGTLYFENRTGLTITADFILFGG